MKNILSDRMLRHISNQIQVGRPIWAMLTLNEYLMENSPLHRIFQKKAIAKLSEQNVTYPSLSVIDKVIKGSKLIELSNKEKSQIKSLNERTNNSKFSQRAIPQINYRKRINNIQRMNRYASRY